jgi:hypothetical protein
MRFSSGLNMLVLSEASDMVKSRESPLRKRAHPKLSRLPDIETMAFADIPSLGRFVSRKIDCDRFVVPDDFPRP